MASEASAHDAPTSNHSDSSHHAPKKKRQPDPRDPLRKKKRIRKKKRKKDPKSYGNGPRHGKRDSMPHHATVQSLASINQPGIVNQLSRMSQDLKFRRELQKALLELKQKDEDYRYAIEIGESLTKENEYLRSQTEQIESQLVESQMHNNILREKLDTLSATYRADLYKYHSDLEASKALAAQLAQEVQDKNKALTQRKSAVHYNSHLGNGQMEHEHQHRGSYGGRSRGGHFKAMTSDDIANLHVEDLGTVMEKQLLLEIQRERKRNAEYDERVENLVKKLDDAHGLQRKYDILKREHRELKQLTKDEMAEHIEMQKSIEQEAIYLATQNSNLEEEREGLLNELDQRNYEITMLTQQLQLQRRNNNNMTQSMSEAQNLGSLGDALFLDDGGSAGYYDNEYGQGLVDEEMEEEYIEGQSDDDNAEQEHSRNSDDDDIDLDDILEDPNLFDGMDEMDEEELNKATNTAMGEELKKEKEKKAKENSKDMSAQEKTEKAFDKIKEFLHLTASAVKIKYPTVRTVQSDDLIKRVKQLPFYKYHDQMVRVMEVELKKEERERQRERAKSKNDLKVASDVDSPTGPTPVLEKRRSFLSIFNIFGGGGGSDEEKEAPPQEKGRRRTHSQKRNASRKSSRKGTLEESFEGSRGRGKAVLDQRK